LGEPEDGEEQEGGIDEADEKKDDGVEGVMLAEVDTAVAGDDSGEMEGVPLEGDCGVLGGAGDGMAVCGVADDPEVDGLEGQSDKESDLQLGINGSHIRTDGEIGVGLAGKARVRD
jgi:hypothetical protein